MIVLSGIPRGGTSVGMQVMIAALGIDRIIGDENPIEKRQAAQAKRREAARARMNDCQRYSMDRRQNDQPQQERKRRARELNPRGFFESPFCVGGIRYSPEMAEDLTIDLDMIANGMPEKVVKVVSQGLAMSDPRHVSKIVYMVRDPRAVAVSQGRLLSGDMMDESTAPEVDGKKALVRSVDMFNLATVAAARWIVKHKKPVLAVKYDDLIDNPVGPLADLQHFINEGDFVFDGAKAIRQELRRSERATETGPAWDFADEIYGLLLDGDFAGIVSLAEARAQAAKAEPFKPNKWHCFRVGYEVNAAICELCHDGGQTPTALNLMHNSDKRKIDWRAEPCLYECGIQGGDGLSIEESIAANHWAALIGSIPGKE